jgi:hypothetical protein
MSFFSGLVAEFKTVGKDIETVFDKAAPIAEFIGQVISAGDPALGNAITATTKVALAVEQQFTAIGASSGTGAQKSAAVLSVIGPVLNSALAATTSAAAGQTAQQIINQIVGYLNLDPALFTQLAALATSLKSTAAPGGAAAATAS